MGYTHGKRWDEETIVNEVSFMVGKLGMKHFPTHTEITDFYGTCDLGSAISRSGGTRYWARKMSLPLKSCVSEKGNDFEILAMTDIKNNTGFDSYQTKPKYPYDIVVDDNIKVDVKASMPVGNGSGVLMNTFNLEKVDPTCDIFILYCLKADGSVLKTLIVPSCILKGKTQVGVGLTSKWDVFKDKWDYFGQYSEFNKSIRDSACIPGRKRSKTEDLVGWNN